MNTALKRSAILLAGILILSGCQTSNTSESRITYSHGDSSVTIERKAESTSFGKDTTTEPDLALLPPITVTPTEIELPNGEKAVSWEIESKGVESHSAFKDLKEVSLVLLKWPVIIAALVLVAGIGICFLPGVWMKRLGIGLSIAGGVLMATSFTFGSYPWMSIVVLGVAGVSLLAMWLLSVVSARKGRKVNKELVSNMELIKRQELDDEERRKYFSRTRGGMFPVIQSKDTQKVVSEIRRDLGYKTVNTSKNNTAGVAQ
jgi:hypothetical protein